ncbi:hypothetical protein L3X38_028325 [Prunus dulcis]|uniref:Uncharacterized protein n=1 Tax=Prunus dulcis TaxID=3755 RepID=A0AAD4Z1Y4_PRUDU|nr:hypothetical protein L3X38_028325 [Prunus dulcis]
MRLSVSGDIHGDMGRTLRVHVLSIGSLDYFRHHKEGHFDSHYHIKPEPIQSESIERQPDRLVNKGQRSWSPADGGKWPAAGVRQWKVAGVQRLESGSGDWLDMDMWHSMLALKGVALCQTFSGNEPQKDRDSDFSSRAATFVKDSCIVNWLIGFLWIGEAGAELFLYNLQIIRNGNKLSVTFLSRYCTLLFQGNP